MSGDLAGLGMMEYTAAYDQMVLVWEALLPLLPIWIFGAVVGLLMPRPKWMSGKPATLILSTPVLTNFRNIAIACHALVILREFWTHFTHQGTFRGLVRATVQWACGNGWTFTWPVQHAQAAAPEAAAVIAAVGSKGHVAETPSQERMDNWYVGEKDLAFFKYHAVEDGETEGATPWEKMMDKDVKGFVKYTSWRRTLPDGKTEYKSVTISPNATAREFSDLYLDDDFRRNWDGMVYHHEVLEHGDFSQRQQVVRWLRRFPFAFLSDREYTIARREFKEGDAIYACSKAIAGHPREYSNSQVVKMDVFWSMWRSRTVADPWGSDKPACETILLHHEQFKIPENLARFAVKHGMWGFVKKLASTVPLYVEARRKRVGMNDDDPDAYGAGAVPNPPTLHHSDSALSLTSMGSGSFEGSDCGSDDSASCKYGHLRSRPRSRRVRGVATMLVAGGLALALGARGSSTNAVLVHGKAKHLGKSRGHRRHHVVVSHVLEEVPELIED